MISGGTLIANVSHELRTPLTVIKGFLELTEENSTLSQEDRLHLKMMSEQAERMSSLVDDLLDAVASGAGQCARRA